MRLNHERIPMRLPTKYLNKHLLMLGEIHGTKESPEAVLDTLNQAQEMGKDVVLGVEYPQEIQPVLDRMGASRDSTELKSTFFFRQGRDGRTSDAMVSLLEAAAARGIPVRAFDLDNTQWTNLAGFDLSEQSAARDQMMGKNLLALSNAYPGNTLVVSLSGNLHSQSLPAVGYSKAGEVVREHGVDMASVRLDPQSGTHWGVVEGAEGWVSGPQRLSRLGDSSEPHFVDEPGGGHDAIYYQGRVHASPPARN